MRPRWLAGCLSSSLIICVAACDSKTNGESSSGSGEATGAAEESTGGGAVDLPSACAAWCQHELDCHPGDALPPDVCMEACTGESEGATPACIEATASWYACRAELACNAEGCPETELDLHCSDAG